jgi:hypothetical protein
VDQELVAVHTFLSVFWPIPSFFLLFTYRKNFIARLFLQQMLCMFQAAVVLRSTFKIASCVIWRRNILSWQSILVICVQVKA